MSLKNVIIAGATGSLGSPILSALLNEPSFNTTILSRASSSAKLPAHIPVKKISDAFTTSELTEAFKGQDAVILALATTPITKDDLAFRLIDAAVAAGVKRFIPSEFGSNNLDPRARKLVPVYDAKGAMLEYLQRRAAETGGRLTWTSFSCGSWLDWALDPSKSGNFLNIDVKNRTATIYDTGLSKFSATTSTNTALAVVRSLLVPSSTANKQIFLSDFVTNSKEIIAELEKQIGENFKIDYKDSAPIIQESRQKFEDGEYNATYELIKMSFMADVDVGLDFEKEKMVWNERLGLPKVGLDGVVREAIEVAGRR